MLRAGMDLYRDRISLEFGAVGAVRGYQTLFEGLSFTVNSGEVLWLQGTNGIGKTTILRMAAGLSRPDGGSIMWRRGEKLCSPSDVAAYQGHKNALKTNLSVIEDLKFWARLAKFPDNLLSILSKVGLSERKTLSCQKLSAGQARRLAIARLLVSRKPLWIMDEPAAAMDSHGQALILSVVNAHIAKGGAALIASHDTAVAFTGVTQRLVLEAP